ncbi:MAG: hypothetical protein HOP11_09645 [Saprospiraceae bacterium]|nr:hypothetical protein [Saprospiraceae bacterium]
MDVSIDYLLLWHLNQHNWIELPGIGSFQAIHKLASINTSEKQIYPSTLHVSYSPLALKKTERMVQNISEHTGYSIESIEQSLAKLLNHLSSELRVRNLVQFEPFGKLLYTKQNDILHFESSNINLHQQFFGMNAIPLPVDENKKIPGFINIPNPTQVSENKSSFNRNLLYLIGLLWLLFIGLLLCPSKKPLEQNVLPAVIDSPKIQEPPITPIQEKKNDSIASPNTVIPETKPIEKKAEFRNEEVINTNNVKSLNSKIKSKKCIIIVGSFKEKKNADKLFHKIKKTKYKSYRETSNNFHRVGIQFDCMKYDLQTVLNSLKKKFSQDAWVLMW